MILRASCQLPVVILNCVGIFKVSQSSFWAIWNYQHGWLCDFRCDVAPLVSVELFGITM